MVFLTRRKFKKLSYILSIQNLNLKHVYNLKNVSYVDTQIKNSSSLKNK